MITDHYATLGLTPHAEHSAIRAAYLTLMRRYHPDRNQSADAAVRVRELTAAYEVLRNRDSRIDYDLAQAYTKAAMAAQSPGRLGNKQAVIALFAFAGVGSLMLLYLNPFAPEIEERIEVEAAVRSPQPALQKRFDPAARCSSAANAELIKQKLFTRAARLRGSEGAVYRRLAAYSVIRMQSANLVRADGDGRTIYCNASIGLHLPPGVVVPGGRRSFSADIGYSLKSADSGRDLLVLFHAGTVARELATLVSVRATADPDTSTDEVDGQALDDVARPPAAIMPAPTPPVRIEQPLRVEPPPRVAPPARVSPPPRVSQSRAVSTQPQKTTSRCGAKNNGAALACNSPAVAALDRDLGMLFRQSVQRAHAAKQRTLYRDHYRFIARLNRCSSETCSRAEYLSRMREISNTMSARPQAP